MPPGIPFLTSFGLIPIRLRLVNYAFIGLVAYGLYVYGFTVIESIALALIWMIVGAYLMADYFYDIPLAV